MDRGLPVRLNRSAHTSRPWRIHEIAPDFRLEDVWALPTPGGPDDLQYLVLQLSGFRDGPPISAPVPRLLFAARWKLGAMFGWDQPEAGLGGRVGSLRERLPADLLDGPRGPDLRVVPFTAIYQTRDEWAAELANRTVHTVMHLGWVPDGAGGYRGQMAVLVKPNGVPGALYMAAIKPFRYLGVYPALLRQIGRGWQANQEARRVG
jgi:hypothetical protein